ncbi:DUF3043 domain-containing protein [Planctomonas psychrotolerans]|uniref:DUF3043 domain-containing protein n=1 Tax=Planctomonas psychrotolerans TaxID=2528712 RepID=UPI00123B25BC|nr:DUF3043 domain-containing protein [Planctomonas psychrotolerans]
MAKQDVPIPSSETAEETAERLGKGRPTPTRREREAANKRPLVPNDRKEAARQQREKARAARAKAQAGMAAGEERYLPMRDRGPQKKYLRDAVDARFSIGELLVPIMIAVIIGTFALPPVVATYIFLLIYVFFFAAAIDAYLYGRILQRRIAEKVGADRVERGVKWYVAMRAFQLRKMRLPRPQVKRGTKVTF